MGEVEFCSRNWARQPSSGSAEAPGNICVGQLDLAVSCTGVGELVPCIGILEVPPQACHLSWDVIVSVLLSHNLSKDDKRDGMKAGNKSLGGVRAMISWVAMHIRYVCIQHG